jgi:site-specific DNA-methyltransferase (cytosine-N4-specific)
VVDFFKYFGLKFENIYVRNIINKRMPTKNSPTNTRGRVDLTMKNEYIVILKK